nr:hypothetical protein [Methylomagnum ishizawai]
MATQVANDIGTRHRYGVFQEAAHITRQQPAQFLGGQGILQFGKRPGHVPAAGAIDSLFLGRDGTDLLHSQLARDCEGFPFRLVVREYGPLQVVGQRNSLEHPADHIEHLVGAKRLADVFHLVEQCFDDPAFTGFARYQVDDGDPVLLLPVAVDAAHALFQPCRVPGNVVIDEYPAKLKVDAFGRRVGTDEKAAASRRVRGAETFDLGIPLLEIQAPVDVGDLVGIPMRFEAPDQEFERIPMFGVDNDLLVGEFRRFQQFPHPCEFGFLAIGIDGFRQSGQFVDLVPLDNQFREAGRYEIAQGFGFLAFVLLDPVFYGLFIGGFAGIAEAVLDLPVQLPLAGAKLGFGDAPGLDILDQAIELFPSFAERTQQGPGAACQPPLENGHGEPRRLPVQQPGLVVVMLDVSGGLVV